ncbi:helix-turn-helix transcriptional regulator [Alishewanella sp. HL-SH05]|uniref:helix-turn-helix transcriptional regulator n=1 Tax=Alishewanella sp. HL-SH05 TaxID=3461145 RepID=UPI0040430F98
MERFTLSRRVGRAIAKLRKCEGLTQAKLSELMKVEKETLSRIETGKISPTLERIEQIAHILNRPVYDFFVEPEECDVEKSVFEFFKTLTSSQKQFVHKMVREIAKLRHEN